LKTSRMGFAMLRSLKTTPRCAVATCFKSARRPKADHHICLSFPCRWQPWLFCHVSSLDQVIEVRLEGLGAREEEPLPPMSFPLTPSYINLLLRSR
jgi:hypothetical protein